MRLKELFYFISIFLVFLGIITSVFLILLTNQMDKNMREIAMSMESIITAGEIEANLLRHNRESYLFILSGDSIHAQKKINAKKRLYYNLDKMVEFVSTPDERRLIEILKEEIKFYLMFRKSLEIKNLNSLEIYNRSSPILDRVFLYVNKLISLNHLQANKFQVISAKANQRANLAGLVVVSAFSISIVLFLYFFKRFIQDPMLNLKDSITQFSIRDKLKPILLKGPIEVREIAGAFNEMMWRLKDDQQAHYRFISAIAHDIRNPLSSIVLSTDFVDQRETDPEKRSFISIIKRQAKYLNLMISDLIDASKIESKDFTLDQKMLDIRNITSEIAELYKKTCSIHQIHLSLPDEPVICYFDPLRISQVLNNLIDNAIKYSPNGGIVFIQLCRESNKPVIKITDKGIGIPPDELKGIFEPFRRTRTTKKTIPGIGLGLSTCKKIMEAHNGSICVESKVGIGSTFSILLNNCK